MEFEEIKVLHVTLALLSISGFLLRGYWMMINCDLLHHRLTKVIPHVNDTIFLCTGLIMLQMRWLHPLSYSWLVAKFVGLVAYIMFGIAAMRANNRKIVRKIAYPLAVLSYMYVFGIAISKSPLSWFS